MPLYCSDSNSCFPLGRWFQKQQQIKTKQNSPKPMNQLTNENPNINHHKRAPTYTIKSNITLQFRPRITQEQVEFFLWNCQHLPPPHLIFYQIRDL